MKRKGALLLLSCSTIFFSCIVGLVGGFTGSYIQLMINPTRGSNSVTTQPVKVVSEESAIIDAVKAVDDSVVSIVISKNVSSVTNNNYYYEQFLKQFGYQFPPDNSGGTNDGTTTQQEVGEGSGFVISADGMIITNKHVVEDTTASYTVIFNNDKKYDAKVLARDTILDIAFLKIDATDLKPLALGSSSNLKVGQTVISIGNALGQFSNTVSSGIISGLSRNITAGDSTGGTTEELSNVIQTDASINLGNSGGPLIDIEGNAIGVNVAVAQGAQNIGFAIPIDIVKDLLTKLDSNGNIIRPQLGVRYQTITSDISKANNLTVDYGAWVQKGSDTNEPAVVSGSAADKAGIKEGDIILEIDGTKLDSNNNTLSNLIQKNKVGDQISIKILRDGQEMTLTATLTTAVGS